MRQTKSTTTTGPLLFQYRPIEDLKLDPKNPRVHSQKQLNQIAESIRAFGMNVPILVDSRLQVVAGHGRVAACKFLNIKKVPTISLKHLNDAQRRAFALADNRLTENSSWDATLLGEQLKLLSEAELDFSIEATGFEMAEIDLYIEGLDIEPELDHADALPSLTEYAVTKIGDLWQLGPHRVLCGDALLPTNYQQLMDGAKADLVITDPPYNVKIDGHATGNGKTRHREFPMASGEMSEAEFEAFLRNSLSLAAKNSKSGSLHFVFMDWGHMDQLLTASKAAYDELKNLCVWAKSAGGMGSLYRSQHELVFVFKAGKGSHRNNVMLGKFGRNRTNVWNYPGANSIRGSKAEGNLLGVHPTVKPVALVADAILDCSSRGSLLLDPFLGSGTAVIAAERTGRICSGMELDPLYVDCIIRRWQKFTGKSAVHAESGRNFPKTRVAVNG